MHKSFVLFLILILSVTGLFAQTNPEIQAIEKNYKYHALYDFIEIMQKSKLSYSINAGNESEFAYTQFVLPIQEGQHIPSIYDRRVTNADGSVKVIEDLPKGDISRLFDEAAQYIEKEDWGTARKLVERATQIDPNYFVAWSYLAQTFLFNDNPLQAIGYLKKAISLNPIAYHEHYLLAMALYQLGDFENALESITQAFIYNRYDPKVIEGLQAVLKAKNMKLYENHMIFPFHIKKVSDTKCDIYLIGEHGESWTAMAVSTAVWMMEPEFKEIDEKYSKAGIFNSIKFYEIFYGQFGEIALRLNNKETVTPLEKRFFNIVNDGYLLQVISWDLLGQAFPEVIYLMKDEEMQKLKKYVQKYVFVQQEKSE
ncbi:MAG: hypothetical protein JW904_09200 [Spirochaetales bacterium]|nr:hypothetical protein [Spirochaetales bacterium]